MKLPLEIRLFSEEETAALAKKFADELKGGEVVAMNGNLGAGKTFFIKNVLMNFKIDNVNSPTFAIVNEYNGRLKVNHFDFYRINRIEELYDIGFEDYLSEPEAVTFIEWANLLPEVLPEKRIEINITVNEDFSRNIRIQSMGK